MIYDPQQHFHVLVRMIVAVALEGLASELEQSYARAGGSGPWKDIQDIKANAKLVVAEGRIVTDDVSVNDRLAWVCQYLRMDYDQFFSLINVVYQQSPVKTKSEEK